MRDRIGGIRVRIDYRGPQPSNEIGCILLAQPTFFKPDARIMIRDIMAPGFVATAFNDLEFEWLPGQVRWRINAMS
jgi:hypothetical protein